MHKFKLIGSAIGNCGQILGCEAAPGIICAQLATTNDSIIHSEIVTYTGGNRDVIAQQEFFTQIAQKAHHTLATGLFPLFIGGDHSCAIGSWSGIATYLEQQQQDLGLIWIDAHLDAHQPHTSPSGNLHGMPAAHLLGYGYRELISILSSTPKIKPENLVYFGIRSFEAAEQDLLQQLGVRIYYQQQLKPNQFKVAFLNEYQRLAKPTKNKVGISLDLDGLDPRAIAAVGTPVAQGINSNILLNALAQINIKDLIGFEIAEYNPRLDSENKTLNYILNLIKLLKG
jgi:arginase